MRLTSFYICSIYRICYPSFAIKLVNFYFSFNSFVFFLNFSAASIKLLLLFIVCRAPVAFIFNTLLLVDLLYDYWSSPFTIVVFLPFTTVICLGLVNLGTLRVLSVFPVLSYFNLDLLGVNISSPLFLKLN